MEAFQLSLTRPLEKSFFVITSLLCVLVLSAFVRGAKAEAADSAAEIVDLRCESMREGRQASPDFNVILYRKRYGDLQNAFGGDLKSYYLHYVNYGKRENRNAV